MKRYVLDARTATNHFPGIGRYVSNLAQALVEPLHGDEQLLLLHDPAQPTRWQLPAAGRQVALVNLPVSPFSLAQQWRVPRELRRLEAAVYHSPYYLMPYRPGVPTLLTLYDFIPQLFPQTVSLQARLLFRLTTRLALRAASHITAISVATQIDLQRLYGVAPGRITTIPLAADPRFRPQPAEEINRVRHSLQLPRDYVLYLGINKPHKGLVTLVQAWELVVRQVERPPLLVVAGAWDERYPEAREEAEHLKLQEHIRFVGPVTDSALPGLYSGAQLFVFPSLYEGFGLPPLEAMACGTAVACGNRSSLPEVAGEAAALFDPTRPESIAATLVELLNRPEERAAMQQASLEQAAQFSWQRTAAETLQLYRELAHE